MDCNSHGFLTVKKENGILCTVITEEHTYVLNNVSMRMSLCNFVYRFSGKQHGSQTDSIHVTVSNG